MTDYRITDFQLSQLQGYADLDFICQAIKSNPLQEREGAAEPAPVFVKPECFGENANNVKICPGKRPCESCVYLGDCKDVFYKRKSVTGRVIFTPQSLKERDATIAAAAIAKDRKRPRPPCEECHYQERIEAAIRQERERIREAMSKISGFTVGQYASILAIIDEVK